MNPNAAPFRPGTQYQAPSSQNPQAWNYQTTQAPTSASTASIATASSTNGSFRFNPFGYNNQRQQSRPTNANNYQQTARQPYNLVAASGQPQHLEGGGVSSNYQHQRVLQHPSQQTFQQQLSQQYYPQQTVNPNQVFESFYPPRTVSQQQSLYNHQVFVPTTDYYVEQQQQQQQQSFMNMDYYLDNVINEDGGTEVEFFNAPENVARVQPMYSLSEQLLERISLNANRTALYEIQIGLEQLVYEGHEFDIWATAVCDRLAGSDITMTEIQLVASLIIEMAILASDAQLNFAKLCQFIDQKIPNFVTNFLIPELNNFLNLNGKYFTCDQAKNICIFLADLYDKMSTDNNTKVPQLTSMIADQLKFMLAIYPVENNVIRSIVQVLKLSGRFLESEKNVLNGIFNDLSEVCCSAENLTSTVTTQVVALMELRKNKWGVSNLDTAKFNSAPTPTTSSTVPISDSEFLRICEVANEEDEIYEDYERFLQETAISAAEKALEKVSFDEEDELIGSPTINGQQNSYLSHTQQQKPHQQQPRN